MALTPRPVHRLPDVVVVHHLLTLPSTNRLRILGVEPRAVVLLNLLARDLLALAPLMPAAILALVLLLFALEVEVQTRTGAEPVIMNLLLLDVMTQDQPIRPDIPKLERLHALAAHQ
jgi:hypothetical protein